MPAHSPMTRQGRRSPVLLLALIGFCVATTVRADRLYLADGTLWEADWQAPTGDALQPVLFVHGHALTGRNHGDPPRYVGTWLDTRPGWLASLPGWLQPAAAGQTMTSFGQMIADDPGLKLTPYYLEFSDDNRTLVKDALVIGKAVQRILEHHNGAAGVRPQGPTAVPLAIVAFSKGTISTRLYLKNLHAQRSGRTWPSTLDDALEVPLPADTPADAVSTFVAIAPPNHGLAISLEGLFDIGGFTLRTWLQDLRDSLPGMQLSNGLGGYSPLAPGPCLSLAAGQGFIDALNGHPSVDTRPGVFQPGDSYKDEAPGSRPNGQPQAAGTLYVTLFDGDGRDSVGGADPRDDCQHSSIGPQGRRLALNLGPYAVNIGVYGIPGLLSAPLTTLGRTVEALTVHAATVHYRPLICQALRAIVNRTVTPSAKCGAAATFYLDGEIVAVWPDDS